MNIVREGKTRDCRANQHHGRDNEGPDDSEDEDRGNRDNRGDDNGLGVDRPICWQGSRGWDLPETTPESANTAGIQKLPSCWQIYQTTEIET